MNWICPDCQAIFRNKNQWHSCVQVTPDHVLEKTSQLVKDLFYELDRYVTDLGDVHRVPLLSCISYKSPVTFLTLKPKSNQLDMEIFLGYKEDVFPVTKIVQSSKSKWVHFVSIDNYEDIDDQLKAWLVDAYKQLQG